MANIDKHKKRVSQYLQVMDLNHKDNHVVIKEVVEVFNCDLGGKKEDKYVIKLHPNQYIQRDIILSSTIKKELKIFVQKKLIANGDPNWKENYLDPNYWKDIPVNIIKVWGKNPREPNGKGWILSVSKIQPQMELPTLDENNPKWDSVIAALKGGKCDMAYVEKTFKVSQDIKTKIAELCKK